MTFDSPGGYLKITRILTPLLLTALAAAQAVSPALYDGLRWRFIGPFRGGRTVAAAGIADQPNVFYVAANNGGIWKTTDAGRTWQPLFDDQSSGSIGSLAIAPSDPNIIYAGSGEGLQRPDLSVGNGIYKSTDAGKSWTHLGLRDGQQIPALLVDPRNPNRVFAAVLGHPYGPNPERGVFLSTDGGVTWNKSLYKDENTGAVDLAFDPQNPDIVYAVLWAARQGPWENGQYNGPGSGLFKSTDGGATWSQLHGGLPTTSEGLARIGLGVAPSDGNRIYALVEARAGGLYRSDDAGATWSRVNSEGRIYGRGDDFAGVRVDPKNPDIVYVANTSTYRSTDGGKNFTAIKGAPGGDDYHTIWINPAHPEIILLAADQGATISVNGGLTWSSWYNQPTAQFYHVVTDNRFPYWVYGGQQESGSAGVASRSDYGEISFRDWHPVGVEEYGYVAPDPLHPGVIYGGKLTRFDESTGMVQEVGPVALRGSKYRFLRTAPVLFSPTDPHTIYLAGNVLFKTSNGGHSWTVISPDLTRAKWDIPAPGGIYKDDAAKRDQRQRGVIYTIAPSPLDANRIWAGTDDGLIQLTTDAGKSWANVTPPALTPWSKVSLLDASHFDAGTAFAAINRFRLDDLHPHIYRTRDSGKTWQETVAGLPDDAPVNAVREDPVRKGLLFAATETAVFVSFDDGDRWLPLRLNMPATSIRDSAIHGADLIAGTHGRGFWILDDITPLRQWNAATASTSAFLFAPAPAYRIQRNQNSDTPLPPEEPAGKNPPDGAIVDFWLKDAPSGPVTLEVLDHAGKLVRKYSSAEEATPTIADLAKELAVPLYWVRPPNILPATPGMHRFVWNLHYPAPASLTHEYPISAIYEDTPRYPLGPSALPGVYTVKLTVNGKSLTQSLTVKMDPRVKTPPDGLRQQFELASKICAMMRQDYDALQQVKTLRKTLPPEAKQNDAARAALEGAAGRRFSRGPSTGAENFNRLNGELNGLLSIVEGADATPTTQASAAAAQLDQSLRGLLTQWRALQAKMK